MAQEKSTRDNPPHLKCPTLTERRYKRTSATPEKFPEVNGFSSGRKGTAD
jgi:hypothetical protein